VRCLCLVRRLAALYDESRGPAPLLTPEFGLTVVGYVPKVTVQTDPQLHSELVGCARLRALANDIGITSSIESR